MNGIIIDDQQRKYSYLKNVFKNIENEIRKYNWLITEIDYSPKNNEIRPFSKPYTWISGEELVNRVRLDNGFWVWGVFSGFSEEISLEEALKYSLPYADGYGGFWDSRLTIQHPLAEVELVEWDGLLFLAITDNQVILEGLKAEFPSARDLREYNLEE